MKHSVKVVFGKEQVTRAHNNESFRQEDLDLFIKEYNFETIEEKNAFIKGLNESVGWMEIYISEVELRED